MALIQLPINLSATLYPGASGVVYEAQDRDLSFRFCAKATACNLRIELIHLYTLFNVHLHSTLRSDDILLLRNTDCDFWDFISMKVHPMLRSKIKWWRAVLTLAGQLLATSSHPAGNVVLYAQLIATSSSVACYSEKHLGCTIDIVCTFTQVRVVAVWIQSLNIYTV